MDYGQLKEEIKTIADIASSVPERFRDKCFEALLQHLLADDVSAPAVNGQPVDKGFAPVEKNLTEKKARQGSQKPKLPAQVRVFLQKTGVTEQQLWTVVTIEDDEVHFLKEPSPKKIAQGQLEWALLLALKTGLTTGTLATDPEEVRSICQDKGFYDIANFTRNFRNAAKYFKAGLVSQGDPQTLSSDGQNELGALLKRLAGAEV